MSASEIPKTKAQIEAMTPAEWEVLMRRLMREFFVDLENGWRPPDDSDNDLERN